MLRIETMKVSLVCLSSDANESSLNFTVFMLRSQEVLLKIRDSSIRILFYSDINQAMHDFVTSGDDTMVILNTMLGFDPQFLYELIMSPRDFVTGVYPLMNVDFEKVRDSMGTSNEEVKHMGLTYNINNIVRVEDDFAVVKSLTEFKCISLKKNVFSTILEKYAPSIVYTASNNEKRHRFMFSNLKDGVMKSAEENFCAMWGGDIYADTRFSPTNFGNYDFFGCVGQRHILR
jgi:hypothetical protein